MQIIKSTPNEGVAYPSIQSWAGETPPDGYYQVADTCDTSAMQTHNGFVTLTVENGIATSITGDDTAYQAWQNQETKKQEKINKQNEIDFLKIQLTNTDYKIIKCSEASLIGENMPYDITTLHTERQQLRDKINQLETELEGSN